MKANSIFITFIFLILLNLSSRVNSQSVSDSCSSNNLNLTVQLPFDASSFNCHPVWDAQGFILRYSQTSSNEWSFVLSAPNTNSYIAMGFSPDGKMVRSSAIVGWVGSDGSATMKRYYLGGQSPNLVVADQGNLQLGNSSSSGIVADPASSRIYMAFQLKTSRPSANLIYAVGPAGRLPSGPSFTLSEHTEKISTNLDYATGQSTQTKSPYANLRRAHGVLNLLGWGILMPIGVMVARYLKHLDPLWFYSHTTIQSFGFVFGVVGNICGFVLNDRLQNNVDKHKALGIFILTLGCLQIIAFLGRPNKESKVRVYWNWYHHTLGRILIILAVANVFYGIHLGNAGSGWNAGYAVAISILFVTSVVLELRMWMRK